MQICPSILEPTAEALVRTVNRLSAFYNYFQIDIGDGIYVSNRTVQIDEIMTNFSRFNNHQNLYFDFHLMVSDFESDISNLNLLKKSLQIKNIFIHLSAISDFSLWPPEKILGLSSIPIGFTLNPEDQVTNLTELYPLNIIPCLQIMSVTPGVQGNPFSPNTLLKIEQLRVLGYKSKIFLDGAVNDKTIPIINKLKYKPDVLCPGSFLTKATNLEERVKFLKNYQ